ncbi:unnamed protein product [Lampetra fluviatilis]
MFMIQKLRRCWRTLMPAMLAILVFMTHMFFKNYVSRDIKLIQAKEWTPHTLALSTSQQAFEAAVQMNATATTNATNGMPVHRGWDITRNTCEPKAKYLKRWWFKSFDPLFKDYVLYRHCRLFPMLHNFPEVCGGQDDDRDGGDGDGNNSGGDADTDVDQQQPQRPFLLLVIKSSPSNFDRRDAIRRTWGRNGAATTTAADGRPLVVHTLFLLGVRPPSPPSPTDSRDDDRGKRARVQRMVDLEARLHGDLLQWDFHDSFYNLTLKDINFLRWFEAYCPAVAYVYKGDDDVFVNVENLLTYLATFSRDGSAPLFVGRTQQQAPPIRSAESKYFVPREMYRRWTYPDYASGGGFVMSRAAAVRIHEVSRDIKPFPIDDVWIGMCLEKAGLAVTQHEGFRTFGLEAENLEEGVEKKSPLCIYRSSMIFHRFLPQEMLDMWVDFKNASIQC